MIFSHQLLNKELRWSNNNHISELVIESPLFYRKILSVFAKRENDGTFTFSENSTQLSLKDDIDVIFNPLKLEFNNKKALTVLLKMLVKTSLSEDFYNSTNRFKTNVVKYINKLIDTEDYVFEVDSEDFNVDAIAKSINLHIIGDEDDFVELLIDYMAMMADLLNTKLFVFVNLRTFLTDSEFKRLVHDVDNHQFNLLLVENSARNDGFHFDKIIIDEDLCEL